MDCPTRKPASGERPIASATTVPALRSAATRPDRQGARCGSTQSRCHGTPRTNHARISGTRPGRSQAFCGGRFDSGWVSRTHALLSSNAASPRHEESPGRAPTRPTCVSEHDNRCFHGEHREHVTHDRPNERRPHPPACRCNRRRQDAGYFRPKPSHPCTTVYRNSPRPDRSLWRTVVTLAPTPKTHYRRFKQRSLAEHR